MKRNNRNEILLSQINLLKEKPYSYFKELLEKNEVITKEVIGHNGIKYDLEVIAVWDDKNEEKIRIIVSVSDGMLSSIFPKSSGFLISPNVVIIEE